MKAVLKIGQAVLDAPTLIAKLKEYQLMPKLVQEVVIDVAIADIECDVQVAVQAYCASRGLFSAEQQQAWCEQQKIQPQQMAQEAVREYKIEQFQEKIWGEQIESYFLQRKSQLDRVRYSLIRTKDASLAQEIYFRLNDDGAPFTELAAQYSEGQESKTGGLVGPVELNIPHPVLGRMLMVSKPGQLWAPTQIGEWMVIAKLEQFLPAQFDEQMRKRLLSERFQEWLEQQLEDIEVYGLDDTPPAESGAASTGGTPDNSSNDSTGDSTGGASGGSPKAMAPVY